MQPLFTTYSDYTLQEYRRFIRTIHIKVLKTPIRLLILLALILLIAYQTSDGSIKIGLVIGLIICPFVLILISRNRSKKAFEEMEKLGSVHSDFNFYDDHAESINKLGNTDLEYDKIFRIIETKTNFYIMMTRQQGALIIKKNCSPELIAFLQSKAK